MKAAGSLLAWCALLVDVSRGLGVFPASRPVGSCRSSSSGTRFQRNVEHAAVTEPNKVSSNLDVYRAAHARSIDKPDEFWDEMAQKHLSWFEPYDLVRDGGFELGDICWFRNGKINACWNCIDRHLPEKQDQVAIIWEGDEVGTSRGITYKELHVEVCRIANALKSRGVGKGEVVTIYMPMIPEVAMVMLACARIGAIHSVVFAGFSAEALRGRILDCNSRYVVVADEGKRGGKVLGLKSIADVAVDLCPDVNTVFVFRYTGGERVVMKPGRDVWMNDLMIKVRPYCPCESMDSEDTLFFLYTSGSTGKPKGVAHSTAGYLMYAAMTVTLSFDLKVSIYLSVSRPF